MAGNYVARILNNAVSGMAVQQTRLAVTSQNIANINTPGYSKRTVEAETRQSRESLESSNIGNGVEVGAIVRSVDEYLSGLVREATGSKQQTTIEDSYLSRVSDIFPVTKDAVTIGSSLNAFFNAANDLSNNASSIQLRTNFIERANDLVNTIKLTFNSLGDLQEEANKRLGTEVSGVNALTAQIATLNAGIQGGELGGDGQAIDQRDKRDELLRQLSEKVSYRSVETADGMISVYLDNGFTLVNGTSAIAIETTTSPSFATGTPPTLLNGGPLNSIVYDYDASTSGTAHVDLTSVLAAGSGTIGGLLRVRGTASSTATSPFQLSGSIVEVAGKVESLTRQLLTTVNNTYRGTTDEDSVTANFQPSSADLDGNSPAVYGLFNFNLSTADSGNDNDGVADDLDSAFVTTTSSINVFSTRLGVTITDPRDVAAARDLNATAGATTYTTGDGSNMRAIAALQNSTQTFSSDNTVLTGITTFSGTFSDQYTNIVTAVANSASRARINSSVANDTLVSATAKRDSIAGVSLDEEYTGIIEFQKAYQASARMIKIAQDLLQELFNAL